MCPVSHGCYITALTSLVWRHSQLPASQATPTTEPASCITNSYLSVRSMMYHTPRPPVQAAHANSLCSRSQNSRETPCLDRLMFLHWLLINRGYAMASVPVGHSRSDIEIRRLFALTVSTSFLRLRRATLIENGPSFIRIVSRLASHLGT